MIGEQRALRQILVNMLSEAIARAAYGERVVLTAIAEGELVELAVSVSRERTTAATKESSLAICLARTLLELQGTSLVEVRELEPGLARRDRARPRGAARLLRRALRGAGRLRRAPERACLRVT